ncbi:MAG: PilZ domain-containing protein [Parasphingorhabdus sp.]|uniref:PilZ domain-containing protein n=1 Tax=Parasphingorhabdus sp. TaxID=2709688 RepID=UPI0032655443
MTNAQPISNADNGHALVENRKASRKSIQAEIFVSQSENKLYRVVLSDISVSGFKMTSRRSLNPNQAVFIRLPGIRSLSATIQWEGFKDYGCQFTHALHPKVFEYLLSKLNISEVASD